mgnify:CR=1 FL=1|tara:strand:+ start:707 stop:964 length:258 start_codon:yes stop_codon:yes gene_type:complete
MNDLNLLKKKILYRSIHRGTKEMDLLLSSFVKKYIDVFNKEELIDLESLLCIDDEILYKWYLNKNDNNISVPVNNISKKLKEYKL